MDAPIGNILDMLIFRRGNCCLFDETTLVFLLNHSTLSALSTLQVPFRLRPSAQPFIPCRSLSARRVSAVDVSCGCQGCEPEPLQPVKVKAFAAFRSFGPSGLWSSCSWLTLQTPPRPPMLNISTAAVPANQGAELDRHMRRCSANRELCPLAVCKGLSEFIVASENT